MRPSDSPANTRGFTLLEVLVALMVFTLAFGVLTQIVQTGLHQSASAEATSVATLLAQSQLARVGVDLPLEVGEGGGMIDERFRWRTMISPAELPMERDELAAFVVEVTIAWGSPDASREVTLTSLRLGPAPP